MYRLEDSDSFDHDYIATYEEVSLLMSSQLTFMRPLVLIGPPGVGRNELKRRMIATNPNLFKTTVPRKFRMDGYLPRIDLGTTASALTQFFYFQTRRGHNAFMRLMEEIITLSLGREWSGKSARVDS